MRKGMDPLLWDVIAAVLAMTTLGTVISVLFWRSTGISPWPQVILSEIGGLSFGVVLLVASSPRRGR